VHVGQAEPQVSRMLPRQLWSPSRDVAGPHAPGAGCLVFYEHPMDARGTRNLNNGYRLCFKDGILIDKQKLPS
jgi:hypothetical protein